MFLKVIFYVKNWLKKAAFDFSKTALIIVFI